MATISTTNGSDTGPEQAVQQLYVPVLPELGQVESHLQAQLSPQFEELAPYLQHCSELGGKRLRPLLLLLSGKALGEVDGKHVKLAACVEMIHTATLIHDDVLDGADQRRHLPAAHRVWGNHAAILLGDYLFTNAFHLASTLGDAQACEILGQATNQVCEGELRQVALAGDPNITEETYLSLIEGKTAALCACSCRLGARASAADESLQLAMHAYGRDIGIAFQIMDDLLDILGSEQHTGKSLGTDLAQVKVTLPLIRVLQQAGSGDRRRIVDLLQRQPEQAQAEMLDWYQRYDAIEMTRDEAEKYVASAREQLSRLPDSVCGATLDSIGPFILSRQG